MICTEDVAREKICLFDRMHAEAHVHCAASMCMAWVFVTTEPERVNACVENAIEEPARPDGIPASWIWHRAVLWSEVMDGAGDGIHLRAYWEQPKDEIKRQGFCGLVHVPSYVQTAGQA